MSRKEGEAQAPTSVHTGGPAPPYVYTTTHTRNGQFIALLAGVFIVFGCCEVVYFAFNSPAYAWALLVSGGLMVIVGIIGIAAAHSLTAPLFTRKPKVAGRPEEPPVPVDPVAHAKAIASDAKALDFAMTWYIRITILITIANLCVLLTDNCQSSCGLVEACTAVIYAPGTITCQGQLFLACWLVFLGLVVPILWLLMGCTRFASYLRRLSKSQETAVEDEQAKLLGNQGVMVEDDEEARPEGADGSGNDHIAVGIVGAAGDPPIDGIEEPE